MGQRANYVIVEEGGFSLYYSHWGACTMERDIVWGPEPTLAFIRAQRRVPNDQWLDDVWGEAGALVDPHARLLLFFSSEDMSSEAAHRRAMLTLLGATWDGWEVRWAYEGLADLVDHLGLDRALVRSDPDPTVLDEPVHIEDDEASGNPISVVSAGGALAIYLVDAYPIDLVRLGPDLLDRLAALPPRASLTMADHPSSGLHIDVAARRLDLWLMRTAQDVGLSARVRWPGWELHLHDDRAGDQVERTGGALVLPPIDDAAQLTSLVQYLRTRTFVDPRDAARRFLADARARGEEATVNPHILEHEPLDEAALDRDRILDAALARIAARH